MNKLLEPKALEAEDIHAWLKLSMRHHKGVNAAVFSLMRILKKVNPGDTYYENYLGHYAKRKDSFVDVYHLMWLIGSCIPPTRIMEIGCRTGISLCQLISPMIICPAERIVLFDTFNDGFCSPELVKMNMRYLNIAETVISMLTFLVGVSRETVPYFKGKHPAAEFDYILVDGGHEKETARMDLENIVDLLASPGIVLFDDITEDGCDLLDVWEDFKGTHASEFLFLENMSGKGVAVGVKK